MKRKALSSRTNKTLRVKSEFFIGGAYGSRTRLCLPGRYRFGDGCINRSAYAPFLAIFEVLHKLATPFPMHLNNTKKS